MPTLSLKRHVNHVNRMVDQRAAHSLATHKVLAPVKILDEMALKAVVSLKVEIKLHQTQRADQPETIRALLDLQIASLEMRKAILRVVIHKTQTLKTCRKRHAIKRCHNLLYLRLKVPIMVILIEVIQAMAALDARTQTLAVNIAVEVEVVKVVKTFNLKSHSFQSFLFTSALLPKI